MNATDQNITRIYGELGGIREELRGLRSDFAALQDRLIQIGFGLAFALVGAMIALVLAVA